MKLRRYIGKDIQEAMLKVKMELGNEAVVINSRKIKQKGFWNYFSKPLIEVVVALDEKDRSRQEKEFKKPALKQNPIKQGFDNDENEEATQYSKSNNETNSSSKIVAEKVKDEKMSELENKVSQMESLIQKVYHEIKAMPKSIQTDRNIVNLNTRK